MGEPIFDGNVTIKVKFNSKAEYQKFRKYILRTEWSYELDYPLFEELKFAFHNVDDLNDLNRYIVLLLQCGFEVYGCNYKLVQTGIREYGSNIEPKEAKDEYINPDEFDIKKIVKDIWIKAGGKWNGNMQDISED